MVKIKGILERLQNDIVLGKGLKRESKQKNHWEEY